MVVAPVFVLIVVRSYDPLIPGKVSVAETAGTLTPLLTFNQVSCLLSAQMMPRPVVGLIYPQALTAGFDDTIAPAPDTSVPALM